MYKNGSANVQGLIISHAKYLAQKLNKSLKSE